MMKNARTIYIIIQMIILFMTIGIIVGFMLLLLAFFHPETSFSFISLDKQSVENRSLIIIILSLLLGVSVVFIYGLFKLRKAIKNLIDHNHFAISVTKNFKLAGKAFVLAAVFHWFLSGMAQIFVKSELTLGLSENTIMYLFAITTGLLLILLSEVLSNARILKEENDLTI